MSPAADAKSILERCRALGFALAGVSPAEPSQYGDKLTSWLAAGRHGEMAWLARNTDIRTNPGSIIDDARSIICVADRYWAESGAATGSERSPTSVTSRDREGADPREVDLLESAPSRSQLVVENRNRASPTAGTRGRVARYAQGDDYHVVMKKRLHALCDELRADYPDDTFRVCVDTAPILEREIAQRAGLGAAGKHTLLIEPGVGSYLLLGEIVTTLDLEPSQPETRDVCETCTRCIDACPTDAITPYSVDSNRCISYLTIEHRSPIDPRYHEPMGDWIFGCDICQEVCPHNHPTQRTKRAEVHEAYRHRNESFDLLEVLGWDEQARREAFTRSALKRAKLDMIRRNALIVAGNALRKREHAPLRRRIEQIAADMEEGEMVRTTARQVLGTVV